MISLSGLNTGPYRPPTPEVLGERIEFAKSAYGSRAQSQNSDFSHLGSNGYKTNGEVGNFILNSIRGSGLMLMRTKSAGILNRPVKSF